MFWKLRFHKHGASQFSSIPYRNFTSLTVTVVVQECYDACRMDATLEFFAFLWARLDLDNSVSKVTSVRVGQGLFATAFGPTGNRVCIFGVWDGFKPFPPLHDSTVDMHAPTGIGTHPGICNSNLIWTQINYLSLFFLKWYTTANFESHIGVELIKFCLQSVNTQSIMSSDVICFLSW
jgi:hypothetical protein